MDYESDVNVSEKIREIVLEILRIVKDRLTEIMASWKTGKKNDHNSSTSGSNLNNAGREKWGDEVKEGKCDNFSERHLPKYEIDVDIQRGHKNHSYSKSSLKEISGTKRGNASVTMKLRRRDVEGSVRRVFLHA